jgi:rhamnulokinase
MKDTKKKFLGIDLGASSGRVFLGTLEANKLKLEQVYSFSNGGIQVFDSLYWDTLRIFDEIKNGIKAFVEKYGPELNGIGLDTWGVGFVLLDRRDEPVGFTHHYRDKRADGMLEEMLSVVLKEEIFYQTGIQFSQINTSTHLFSLIRNKSPELVITKTLLMTADYFNFLLSGAKYSEYSLATTSQLYNPIKKDWAYNLIEKLGFDPNWFQKVVDPGTILGKIHDTAANQTGLDKQTPVIAPLCHDTAAAVAAVPVEEGIEDWAYISSGTWSLMGLELKQPIINEKALEYNLTNEGGAFGTICFLKIITGLWLMQECKKLWDSQGASELSYPEVMRLAEKADPFISFICPDNALFLNSDNMIQTIQAYCKRTNQEIPNDIGAISRIIFEGLAFRYRQILDQIQDITDRRIEKIYIVGGGSKNSLLNQFTANITNLPVDSGPTEASAIGNILMQAVATKEIDSLRELRKIVRDSFEIRQFKSRDVSEWNDAYETYLNYYDLQRNTPLKG